MLPISALSVSDLFLISRTGHSKWIALMPVCTVDCIIKRFSWTCLLLLKLVDHMRSLSLSLSSLSLSTSFLILTPTPSFFSFATMCACFCTFLIMNIKFERSATWRFHFLQVSLAQTRTHVYALLPWMMVKWILPVLIAVSPYCRCMDTCRCLTF